MIIDETLISIDLDVVTKEEAITKMSEMAGKGGRLSDLEIYCQSVKKREGEVSTDMGFGIAIPHGKSEVVLEPFIVFAKLSSQLYGMKKKIAWLILFSC